MDIIERRLAELKQEYYKGKDTLEELDTKRNEVSLVLTRISGAIQVLEEILETVENKEDNDIPAETTSRPTVVA